MLKRSIEKNVNNYLSENKNDILFVWGPRRSGKTTLLEKISQEQGVRIFNFDTLTDREKFVPRREVLQNLISENRLILIDEVQNYPESTVVLKILHDEFKTKIIATGSSELRQTTRQFDSLAGRFMEQYCLPLSAYEILENMEFPSYEKNLFVKKLQEDLQIYGAYPEIYAGGLTDNEKESRLQKILDTYVLKDVVSIYNLKDTKLAKDILIQIALQLGSEVSMTEIANKLGANKITVSNYIEIFIKNYILIPLPSFKTNLRRAVSEYRKLYFYDLGIRNILVRDFRDLILRPDRGGVFENFIVAEIEKWRKIHDIHKNTYFYREYNGAEVDVILEDYKKQYTTLEIKVNKNTKKNKNVFPIKNDFKTINPENYLDLIQEVMN